MNNIFADFLMVRSYEATAPWGYFFVLLNPVCFGWIQFHRVSMYRIRSPRAQQMLPSLLFLVKLKKGELPLFHKARHARFSEQLVFVFKFLMCLSWISSTWEHPLSLGPRILYMESQVFLLHQGRIVCIFGCIAILVTDKSMSLLVVVMCLISIDNKF